MRNVKCKVNIPVGCWRGCGWVSVQIHQPGFIFRWYMQRQSAFASQHTPCACRQDSGYRVKVVLNIRFRYQNCEFDQKTNLIADGGESLFFVDSTYTENHVSLPGLKIRQATYGSKGVELDTDYTDQISQLVRDDTLHIDRNIHLVLGRPRACGELRLCCIT